MGVPPYEYTVFNKYARLHEAREKYIHLITYDENVSRPTFKVNTSIGEYKFILN